MKTRRIWFQIAAIALLPLLGSVMTAPVRTSAQEGSRTASSEESVQERDGAASDHYKNRDYMKVQWDLVKGVPGTPPFTYLAERGGTATAYAEDGSKIILTGSGTFRVPSGRVTGGGTWQTFDADGALTGSGMYRVQSFISHYIAPGLHPPSPPLGDNIGNIDDTRAGLLLLTVDYLDGTDGLLAVSCHLSENQEPKTPGSVFEGMHATKGYADYWRHAEKSLGDSNTLFHVQFYR